MTRRIDMYTHVYMHMHLSLSLISIYIYRYFSHIYTCKCTYIHIYIIYIDRYSGLPGRFRTVWLAMQAVVLLALHLQMVFCGPKVCKN